MLLPSHLLITIWPHQSLSDPYTSQLLLLPTHQLKELTVHLLATIFHPLIGAVVTRYCYLRHRSVVLRLWLIGVYVSYIIYAHYIVLPHCKSAYACLFFLLPTH